ncbi:MAG: tetratricopeptide repeat protein [Chitinispirillales bacterium]|nr:tetratricopeptide repeat protein [Chitinispirillales bacterium]
MMTTLIHRITALTPALLLFISAPLLAQPQGLPADLHTLGANCIELVFKEDYKNAEEEAKKIVRAYPEHPAGYFFLAAVADAWMLRYQSNKREAEFYRHCDQSVEKAEKILAADPNDDWARFFMGGAEGYKGTYEARYERYITAFRFGWKGVSVFIKMAAAGSKNPDINFGIGTYDYWRSALMKLLWWMPGVDDKRAVGIEKLKGVMKDGVYSRQAAGSVLIDVYLNENRFENALSVANEMNKKYPRCLIYLWGRAAALQGLKRHDEAVSAYQAILVKCEKDPNSNYYNAVKARVGMAKSLAALGRNGEAVEQAAAVGEYQLTKDIKKRLDSQLSDAEKIKKRAGKGGGAADDGGEVANN